MGLFKKKERVVVTEIKCPADGCSFVCTDNVSLKRHLEWKHPGLSGQGKKEAEKVG